jgi:hypothetical protein
METTGGGKMRSTMDKFWKSAAIGVALCCLSFQALADEDLAACRNSAISKAGVSTSTFDGIQYTESSTNLGKCSKAVNAAKIGKTNKNGTTDYGCMQINSNYTMGYGVDGILQTPCNGYNAAAKNLSGKCHGGDISKVCAYNTGSCTPSTDCANYVCHVFGYGSSECATAKATVGKRGTPASSIVGSGGNGRFVNDEPSDGVYTCSTPGNGSSLATFMGALDTAFGVGRDRAGSATNTVAATAPHINVQSNYNTKDEMDAMRQAAEKMQLSDFLTSLLSSVLNNVIGDLLQKSSKGNSGPSFSDINVPQTCCTAGMTDSYQYTPPVSSTKTPSFSSGVSSAIPQ